MFNSVLQTMRWTNRCSKIIKPDLHTIFLTKAKGKKDGSLTKLLTRTHKQCNFCANWGIII